jgi:hypothetical protein
MSDKRPLQFGMRSLFVAVATAAAAIWAWDSSVDTWGKALAAIFGQHTVFADGYSDRRWNAVRLGMEKSEILQILGEPLSRGDTGDWWAYSTQLDTTENYHRREVIFQSGKVSEKLAEFTID